MNYPQTIQHLYPNSLWGSDFMITTTEDGTGSVISKWNTAKLGPQPTLDSLIAAWPGVMLGHSQEAQVVRVEAGFTNATYNTPVPYMGTSFWTDQTSQFMLLGAVVGFSATGATPAGFTWWDSTGAPVAMTLANLVGLYQVTMSMFNTNFVRNKALLGQINAATTIAQVQAVIW